MQIPKVVIVGGGIAGLACARRLFELKEENRVQLDILLLEAGSRFGGAIETESRDGFVLEKGADSFLSEKPWVLNLCKKLGIESEIIGTRDGCRKNFVVCKGRLIESPEGFYLIAPTRLSPFLNSPLFSWKGKLRMAAEFFLPKGNLKGDESVGSFIRRRFGEEALERVAQAMLTGIYMGDPDLLSLDATMPRFKELEQEHGSVIKGLFAEAKKKKEFSHASGPRYSLFLSFREGMKVLVKGILEKLPSESLRLKSGLKRIHYDLYEKKWHLEVEDGKTYTADAVCMSLPSNQAGLLLKEVRPDLSQKLSQISYESVATINFALRRDDINHPLDGFGFVVPRRENRSLISCSFSSVKFHHRASEEFVLLRAFAGGAFGKAIFNKEDRDMKNMVFKDLSDLLGIRKEPLFSDLTRYQDTMPQYQVGHLRLTSEIQSILEEMKGLFLIGSSYRGSGIPDCVHDAEVEAEEIYQSLCRSHETVGSEW